MKIDAPIITNKNYALSNSDCIMNGLSIGIALMTFSNKLRHPSVAKIVGCGKMNCSARTRLMPMCVWQFAVEKTTITSPSKNDIKLKNRYNLNQN